MKRPLILPFILLMFTLFSACQEDDGADLPQFHVGAKLKRVISFPVGSSENSRIIEVYAYDDKGRITRISTPGTGNDVLAFSQYQYNDEDQLVKIAHYEGYEDNFINTLNQNFTYNSRGQKEKELVENPFTATHEYFLFRYEGDQLLKSERYNQHDELQYYTLYQFDAPGNLIKESTYGNEDDEVAAVVHTYSGGLRMSSRIYSGEEKEVVREEMRYYDDNKNLIILESKAVAPWLSSVSYEHRYEYMD